MPRALSAAVVATLLIYAPAVCAGTLQQKAKKEKPVRRDVLRFDGGIVFETDGSLSELTCFRVTGRVTSGDFFDHFKRIDDASGTEYRRGEEVTTEFPQELNVSFLMFDISCDPHSQQPVPRKYLTMEMMKAFRFQFYWKRGIELRRIEDLKQEPASAEPVEPYNADVKQDLPPRFRWTIGFTIPSAGVPLTDRLVLIIRTPDGRTAARVAARL